jgi:hypothetical protein
VQADSKREFKTAVEAQAGGAFALTFLAEKDEKNIAVEVLIDGVALAGGRRLIECWLSGTVSLVASSCET